MRPSHNQSWVNNDLNKNTEVTTEYRKLTDFEYAALNNKTNTLQPRNFAANKTDLFRDGKERDHVEDVVHPAQQKRTEDYGPFLNAVYGAPLSTARRQVIGWNTLDNDYFTSEYKYPMGRADLNDLNIVIDKLQRTGFWSPYTCWFGFWLVLAAVSFVVGLVLFFLLKKSIGGKLFITRFTIFGSGRGFVSRLFGFYSN